MWMNSILSIKCDQILDLEIKKEKQFGISKFQEPFESLRLNESNKCKMIF